MALSLSDFELWKTEPVTKAFYLAMAEAIEKVKEDLSLSAGLDSNEDNFKRGYIRAMFDAIEFRVEDEDDN